MKEKYKQTIQPMGVYQIRNAMNGKILLGSARDLKGILNRSRFQLRNGLHTNKEMQSEFKDAGEENFSFDVLDRLEPDESKDSDYAEELMTLEDMWLDKLEPYNEKGYNMKKVR